MRVCEGEAGRPSLPFATLRMNENKSKSTKCEMGPSPNLTSLKGKGLISCRLIQNPFVTATYQTYR